MRNNCRVVIDTNVIISSLVFGGKPRELLKRVVKEKIPIYTSSSLTAELADVLRKKFHFSEAKIKQLVQRAMRGFRVVYPTEHLTVVRDVADNRVLEVACEGDCDFVVTGDKDLLVLKKYKDIRIVTSAEFLGIMDGL